MTRKLYEPNHRLDVRESDIDLICAHEGFAGRWYLCPAGVWTMGYGMTENIISGWTRSRVKHVTGEEARAALRYALSSVFEPVVEHAVKVPLSAGEFAALVSFVFNLGPGQFRSSTLLRRLNAGDREAAAAEFERWVWATVDGVRMTLPGLVTRRRAERALFEESPDYSAYLEKLEPLAPHLFVSPDDTVPRTLTPNRHGRHA